MNRISKISDPNARMSSKEIADVMEKQHKHVMRDIKTLIDEGAITEPRFGLSEYKDASGKSNPMYKLDFEATMTLITGYDAKRRAMVINRWMKLEMGQAAPALKHDARKEEFELELLGATYAPDILKLSDNGRLQLIHAVYEKNGVSTLTLPEYTEKVRPTFSAKDLLVKNSINISSNKFNKLMIEKGLMEVKSRTRSNGQQKTFKSLTGEGLKYGQNDTHKSNPRETQAHYYEETFLELFGIIMDEEVAIV